MSRESRGTAVVSENVSSRGGASHQGGRGGKECLPTEKCDGKCDGSNKCTLHVGLDSPALGAGVRGRGWTPPGEGGGDASRYGTGKAKTERWRRTLGGSRRGTAGESQLSVAQPRAAQGGKGASAAAPSGGARWAEGGSANQLIPARSSASDDGVAGGWASDGIRGGGRGREGPRGPSRGLEKWAALRAFRRTLSGIVKRSTIPANNGGRKCTSRARKRHHAQWHSSPVPCVRVVGLSVGRDARVRRPVWTIMLHNPTPRRFAAHSSPRRADRLLREQNRASAIRMGKSGTGREKGVQYSYDTVLAGVIPS